jgi:adenylyl-sulfate kinase
LSELTSRSGFTIWLTGLSGAGKSTIAEHVAQHLRASGVPVEVLDGDVVRTSICAGLGFSREDRDTNIRRIGFVAQLLSRNGVVVIVAAISPYAEAREDVRTHIGPSLEVYVRCPIDVLAARDAKGLYRRALAGEISHFTGVSDPYEEPEAPDLVIDTSAEDVETSVARLLAAIDASGLLRVAADGHLQEPVSTRA